MSVNKVIVLGNLGKDPEIRYMPNGEAVANFSIATTETWKDKSGEKKEKTEWHNCVAYKKLAEIIGEYVKKGSQIYVEGKLQTRKWQDKEGKDRYTTEIIINEMKMLGSKVSQTKGQNPQDSDSGQPADEFKDAAKKSFDNFDDDIPF